MDAKRAKFSLDRRLKRLEWSSGTEPGRFVLENLCPATVQADYYPGQTYAEYLGSRGDLILCDYYVWIKDIREKADLISWINFIRSYETAAKALHHYAVFVLEYSGQEHDVSPFPAVNFEINSYDCRVFCLQLASELQNSASLSYQTELASSICMNHPELAALLLYAGDKLLDDPFRVAQRTITWGKDAEEMAFPSVADEIIHSNIWKARLVLLYPIIEQYRLRFISRFEMQLKRFLPIHNSNGDIINEPTDLEIGPIYYIVSSKANQLTLPEKIPQEEIERIRLCRDVRNLLAHNRPIPFNEVYGILCLQST